MEYPSGTLEGMATLTPEGELALRSMMSPHTLTMTRAYRCRNCGAEFSHAERIKLSGAPEQGKPMEMFAESAIVAQNGFSRVRCERCQSPKIRMMDSQ